MKKLCLVLLFLLALSLIPSNSTVPTDLSLVFAPIDSTHPLGCDFLGRDIFSLMIYGFLRTATVVFVGTFLGLGLGLILGLLGGYYGGFTKVFIRLFSDISLVVPSFIIALIISAFFGLTPLTAGIALGIFDVGTYGNQSMSLTEQTKNSQFILVEKLLGTPHHAILFKHILPNIIQPIQVLLAGKTSSIILSYAGLSFIGLGADITKADWGGLLYEYRVYLVEKPLLVLWPSLGILIFALFFHLVFDSNIFKKRRIFID